MPLEENKEDKSMQEKRSLKKIYKHGEGGQNVGVVDSETDLMTYVSTDEDLVTRETITKNITMEEIRDVVDAKNGEDDDDNDEPETSPTIKEALAVQKKLHFLECDGNIDSVHLRKMELLEFKLVEIYIRKAKQITILNFSKNNDLKSESRTA